MAKKIALTVCAFAMLAGTAFAEDVIPPVIGGNTYARHLIMLAKSRYPNILSIVVEGKRDEDKIPVLLGSTHGSEAAFTRVSRPAPSSGAKAVGNTYVVHQPYVSSTGHAIGTITTTFVYHNGTATAPLDATARAIAQQLARATLSAKNAADPYPYDKAFGPTTYAQALTERTVARHADLLVMMIHATPPGHDRNIIIGSNIGRFGKEADEDDARVIDKGETNLEIGGDKDRFETELPLNDASGKRIGALGLVFPYHEGQDKEALHRHGLAIRDEIARQIPDNAALFKPR